VALRQAHAGVAAISPRALVDAIHDNQSGPDLYDLRAGRCQTSSAPAAMSDAHWLSESGELLTTDAKGLSFWTPGKWTIDRRLAWPKLRPPGKWRGLAPDHRTAWIQPPGGIVAACSISSATTDYAIWNKPLSSLGTTPVSTRSINASSPPRTGAVLMWSLAELRYELADLGLDWAMTSRSGIRPGGFEDRGFDHPLSGG